MDKIDIKNYNNYSKQATEKFVNLGLMSEEQKNEWDNLPLRSSGISERYNLIGLGKLVDNKI